MQTCDSPQEKPSLFKLSITQIQFVFVGETSPECLQQYPTELKFYILSRFFDAVPVSMSAIRDVGGGVEQEDSVRGGPGQWSVRCAHGYTEIFVALIRGVVDYSSEFSLQSQCCKQTRERKIIPRGHKTRRAKNSALQELSFSRGGDFTRLHMITYFARASLNLRKILQTSQPYICSNQGSYLNYAIKISTSRTS